MVADMLKSIDDKTNLAGTNRLEVLMFSLGLKDQLENETLFGINVFKVRELMTVPDLINIPDAPPSLAGIANIRGKAVPVIDLNHFCNYDGTSTSNILIVTEFNTSTQGFMVSDVDDIVQLDWSRIVEPSELVRHSYENMLTGMSKLDNDKILLLIDVEKVIAEVLGADFDSKVESSERVLDSQKYVFFADDSNVARAQVARLLDKMQLQHKSAKNGRDAWEALEQAAEEAEAAGVPLKDTLQAIVTDVEMPHMDGYVLTTRIKSDKRFNGIPVMMHSSLSAEENKKLGMKVGADAYVAKLIAAEFSKTLNGLISHAGTDKQAA